MRITFLISKKYCNSNISQLSDDPVGLAGVQTERVSVPNRGSSSSHGSASQVKEVLLSCVERSSCFRHVGRFEWKLFFCSLHLAVHVGHFQEMLHCGICIISWGARLLQLTNESPFNAAFALSFLWRADGDSSVFPCDGSGAPFRRC